MAITYDTRNNYDASHGSAFDRGSADSYYGRPRRPHMWAEDQRVGPDMMTPQEIAAYNAGYQWNEQFGDKKCWD